MKTEAAFLTAPKTIKISEIDVPVPGINEIQVKPEYVGICGSDLHFFEEGRIGTRVVEYPFILGHECAGVVTKTGEGVTGLSPGDRVALEPGIPCGKCEFCKEGRYNLCPDVKFMATPPINGAFVRVLNFPAHMSFKLPDNVSAMEGALIEPLAVGMHAARQGEVKPGKTAVILGAGCIGLTTLLSCRSLGASVIVVTDLFDKRLEKARELGADFTVNTSEDNANERIRELTGGEGYDIVFETAGSVVTAAQTSYLSRRGGIIVMVGNIVGETLFNFRNMYLNELTLKSVFRYRNIYPAAITEIAAGRINVKSIATNIYDFEEIQSAFEEALYDKKNVVKAVVKL